MASYINIVDIPAQESEKNVANAFASALAKAVGWVLDADGVTVWHTSDKVLGVRFMISGSFIYPAIVNAGGVSGVYQYTRVDFGSSSVYKLYWVKTSAGTVAFGMFTGEKIYPTLTVVVGKNEDGIWSALHMQASNSMNANIAVRTTTQTAEVPISISVNYGVNNPLALVRLPDIANSGMFLDIYAVLSTPTASCAALFYINGRYYRPIKMNNDNNTTAMMLAVPVG